MSSDRSFSINPIVLLRSIRSHSRLTWQLAKRDALGRYKGTALGVAWAFVTPMLMLAVYTFVFSEVFKAKWPSAPTVGQEANHQLEFAIILFIGLMVFQIFSECIAKAPVSILSHANYVKKIVFPLEILVWINLISALLHAGIALAIIVVAIYFMQGTIPYQAIFVPFILLPFLLFILGTCWFLSSVGVFWRDIAQPIGLATTALLFLSPVFFPASAVPEHWKFLIHLNPLTQPIEMTRNLLLQQTWPNCNQWLGSLAKGTVVAIGGFAWFQKTRHGFADVM